MISSLIPFSSNRRLFSYVKCNTFTHAVCGILSTTHGLIHICCIALYYCFHGSVIHRLTPKLTASASPENLSEMESQHHNSPPPTPINCPDVCSPQTLEERSRDLCLSKPFRALGCAVLTKTTIGLIVGLHHCERGVWLKKMNFQ